MDMKVLVVGGGGREHAIAVALARSGRVEIFSAMARRNPGIDQLAKKVILTSETDVSRVCSFAAENAIDYAFIGPEAPLEAGVVDLLERKGISCVGPTRAAARIETDKAYCRDMMDRHAIEGCPRYRVFNKTADAVAFIRQQEGDLAIKPVGLTGGKGVKIMGEQVDREGAIRYVESLKGGIIIEDRLMGEEFTLQAFVDGRYLAPMPLVQDHKRAFEGDTGPNTGGMGSYSMPDHMLPFVSDSDRRKALGLMKSVVDAMDRTGQSYKGILYGQFMNTGAGPKVIEFNARFGDPEAMNVLTLLTSDLPEIVERIVDGKLASSKIIFENKATVCKYLVPEGYPDAPNAGDPVSVGKTGDALVYYANVEEHNGKLVTLKSRTLAVVGTGNTLDAAEHVAENAASSVGGRVRYRRDIGTRALLERRISHMKELR